MRRKLFITLTLIIACIIGIFTGCGSTEEKLPATEIKLSDGKITVDGAEASVDAEGTASGDVYLSNDIIYYEDKDSYESGYPYGEGEANERHSAEEAAAHTVVNITQPGRYRLSGTLSKGQIRVDLGEDAFTNPEAVVTLVLDGANITCEVAPAILFLNVYECDNDWTVESATSEVSTEKAGANLVVADKSTNEINGSHVARIYKDKEGEKKLWKQDGAIYSYMSMNVDGESKGNGVLNLHADNEGLDTELHLTLNGGKVNIYADNDGINTNEDGVSVTTINGGELHILAGLGAEGDGIDSNGWLVINGGTVIASANPAADAGLDSDMGSFINGGTVVAFGSTMDWAESDSNQVTMNLQFAQYCDSDSAIEVKKDKKTIFRFDPADDKVFAAKARQFRGAIISCAEFAVGDEYSVYVGGVQQGYTGNDVMMGPGGFGGNFGGNFNGGEFNGQMPEGMTPPEGMEIPEGGFGGGRGERPEGGKGERPAGGEGNFGEWPENMPEGFQGGFQGGYFGGSQGGTANAVFTMSDKVNSFSGVADYVQPDSSN